MKKIVVMLCALIVCLLSACADCGFSHGNPSTTYKWSYDNNGTTSSGEFTTNEYGQATFEVPDGTDCNKVTVKEKDDGVKIAPEAPPIS
jgi:hypothetical protein